MLWLLLILLLLSVLLLFWLPIQVKVDTEREVYRASWKGIISIWGIPEKEGWKWYFQLFFWKKNFEASKYTPKKERKPAKKVSRKLSLKQVMALARNLISAIHIKYFNLNWDTSDFVLNAWLYPVFRLVSQGKYRLNINFTGQQDLAIHIQTRPGLIAFAVLKVFIHL